MQTLITTYDVHASANGYLVIRVSRIGGDPRSWDERIIGSFSTMDGAKRAVEFDRRERRYT